MEKKVSSQNRSIEWLKKSKVPRVLIPGLILAAALGWKGINKMGPDYYENKRVFPVSGQVSTVLDGDTFELNNGVSVRLVGVDAPNRGDSGTIQAGYELRELIGGKKVWLEYDRYQDDKYGRILAWVWINCENTPKFLPADYMHKSKRESNPGLVENPPGCKEGTLIQEELVRQGVVWVQTYEDRGELKYSLRLDKLTKSK